MWNVDKLHVFCVTSSSVKQENLRDTSKPIMLADILSRAKLSEISGRINEVIWHKLTNFCSLCTSKCKLDKESENHFCMICLCKTQSPVRVRKSVFPFDFSLYTGSSERQFCYVIVWKWDNLVMWMSGQTCWVSWLKTKTLNDPTEMAQFQFHSKVN